MNEINKMVEEEIMVLGNNKIIFKNNIIKNLIINIMIIKDKTIEEILWMLVNLQKINNKEGQIHSNNLNLLLFLILIILNLMKVKIRKNMTSKI